MKILVIEDEPKVASFIKEGLEDNGYDVEVAFDGAMGKKLALKYKFDLMVMDIIIPHINGLELLKILRSEKINIPIIMLTALGTTDDKVGGLETGADDYLVKPFEFKELLARIRSLLKRAKDIRDTGNILQFEDLIIDLDKQIVKRKNIIINLTSKEFDLLEYFVRNPNKLITRLDIAGKVWDIDFETGTNVIDVYVHMLRKKIDRTFSPKLIHTLLGKGYIFQAKEDENQD